MHAKIELKKKNLWLMMSTSGTWQQFSRDSMPLLCSWLFPPHSMNVNTYVSEKPQKSGSLNGNIGSYIELIWSEVDDYLK